ncbi:MAG: beta-ketoacyl synthase N-terminal-like domain-containing protein [Anaerolineales bacterium]
MTQEDKIAIAGVSGRFPESASVSEFLDNLFGRVDMLTTDDRRWPAGALGIPERHGQLKVFRSLITFF